MEKSCARTSCLILLLVGIVLVSGCQWDSTPGRDAGSATLSLAVLGLDTVVAPQGSEAVGSVARGLVVSNIAQARVSVDGLNFTAPATATVALNDGAGVATLSGLEIGPNRVISVTGLDGAGNPVPGAQMYGSTDLYPGDNSTSVNWESTPRGQVLQQVLADDRANGTTVISRVDAAALQAQVSATISDNNLTHPCFVDVPSLAADVIANDGVIPSSTAYWLASGSVSLDISGIGAGSWPIEVRITDPASTPITVTADGPYSIAGVCPGNWNVVLSINNSAYEEQLVLDPVQPGAATTSATDTSGNTVDLVGPWDLSAALDVHVDFTDSATYSWEIIDAPQVQVEAGAAIGLYDGKVFVAGGVASYDSSSLQRYYVGTRDIWAYDLAAASWQKQAGRLPYGCISREELAGTIGSVMVLSPTLGPEHNNGWGDHNQVIEYDMATPGQDAVQTAALSSGDIWFSTVVNALDRIVMLCGWNGGPVRTIWEYDTETDQATSIGSLSQFANTTATVDEAGRVIIFGRPPFSSDPFSVQVYDPASDQTLAASDAVPADLGGYMTAWSGRIGGTHYNFVASRDGSVVYEVDTTDPMDPEFTPAEFTLPVASGRRFGSKAVDPNTGKLYMLASTTNAVTHTSGTYNTYLVVGTPTVR